MPGNAHVFAEGRNIFHIEFVEGHDAVDGLRPSGKADGIDEFLDGKFFGHEKDFVDGRAGPISFAEFFDS